MTTPTPVRSITVRRPDLDFCDLPKYFVKDDILRSHIAAMLSAVFPEGEDFFVRSVRNYRDRLTDPELRRQVSGFIGQEALHGREHRAFNQALHQLGYPTRFTDRRVKIGLGIFGRVAPKRTQLALTAALEHYTATLAEVILRDGIARAEFTDPRARELFTWHAMEESEHKSVAFDVFQQVCGIRRVRVGVMYGVHGGFLVAMSASVVLSVLLDRDARRQPLRVLQSIRGLRTHPFLTKDVVRRLRDYDRTDFHPDDHDTNDVLDHWRTEFAAA